MKKLSELVSLSSLRKPKIVLNPEEEYYIKVSDSKNNRNKTNKMVYGFTGNLWEKNNKGYFVQNPFLDKYIKGHLPEYKRKNNNHLLLDAYNHNISYPVSSSYSLQNYNSFYIPNSFEDSTYYTLLGKLYFLLH